MAVLKSTHSLFIFLSNFAQNIDREYPLNRLTKAVLTSNHNLFFCPIIFAQNIDGGYPLLTEAVLTSNYNLCFRVKIENNVYPRKKVFQYNGCKWIFHYMDMLA